MPNPSELERQAETIVCASCAPLLAERDAALAEAKRLRKALQPFAHQARIIASHEWDGDGTLPDEVLFRLYSSYAAITVGNCRRAREALGEGKEKP